jgi:hypothetical protein
MSSFSRTEFPNLPQGGTVRVTRPVTGLVKPKTVLARFGFVNAGANPAMDMKIEFSFRVVLPDPEGGDVALYACEPGADRK